MLLGSSKHSGCREEDTSRFRQSSTLAAHLLVNCHAHAQRLLRLRCLTLPATPFSMPSPSCSRLQWTDYAGMSMGVRLNAAALEGARP